MPLSNNITYNIAVCVTFAVFFLLSKLLFDEVFKESQLIIDEEFHIPQGVQYCNFTFDTVNILTPNRIYRYSYTFQWNPKITTLPGLYLVSSAILGPLRLCSLYGLRFINLLASFLNLLLFHKYLNLQNPKNCWANLISSINIAILPPLYFFSCIYYTDVISITFILLANVAHKQNNHLMASLYGALSVLMRQTNIVWVVFLIGQYALKKVLLNSRKKRSKDIYLSDASSYLKIRPIVKNLMLQRRMFWINIVTYMAVVATFALFVFLNGSIVVGDKTAHTASVHVPQLFYFFIFSIIFGWPHFLTHISSCITHIRRRLLFFTLILVLFVIIVYINTLEHDYLLADNRHYTFYIWNRFYAKYKTFRYLMVPVYYFGLYGLLSILNVKHRVIFTFMFSLCTIVVLIFQKMIEIRYFLIPYILFRLHLENMKWFNLVLEFCTFCVINFATFYIFFTKDIYWSNYDYAQKLIW
ncbi:hypothetical protein RI129_005484 [Pyrocoelia pectoralis]|uniref:Dol-P-Glc:Glc(2)Man(9)GlcNAc(2)-PP-Dol alpha-1,2-glucosyltransferase n=1 Tax=Pyrocoelia pectoralis TaxID=417401 RepID=A0AAN7VEA0_9COLE